MYLYFTSTDEKLSKIIEFEVTATSTKIIGHIFEQNVLNFLKNKFKICKY